VHPAGKSPIVEEISAGRGRFGKKVVNFYDEKKCTSQKFLAPLQLGDEMIRF